MTGAPRCTQVRTSCAGLEKTEPAPHMRFVFDSPAAPHPEPWVRFGFGAGSGCSRTGPRPVYSLICIVFRQRRRLPPFKPRKYCNAHDKGPNDGLPSFVVLLLLLLFTNIYLLSDYVRRQRMVITTITYHCDGGTTAGDRSTPPSPY